MSFGLTVHDGAKIVGEENISFGDPVIIDDFVFIYAKDKIDIGNYVHIACFSSVIASEKIRLGDFSAVSHGCRILTATDDFVDGGFGNSTLDERYRNLKKAPIEIGKFCIIGANSVVLPGVTVGEGTTVGACSVVTRDLEPWGVYIGNKRVGERDRNNVMKNYEKFLLDNPNYKNGTI